MIRKSLLALQILLSTHATLAYQAECKINTNTGERKIYLEIGGNSGDYAWETLRIDEASYDVRLIIQQSPHNWASLEERSFYLELVQKIPPTPPSIRTFGVNFEPRISSVGMGGERLSLSRDNITTSCRIMEPQLSSLETDNTEDTQSGADDNQVIL